jgi:hypothetical protein
MQRKDIKIDCSGGVLCWVDHRIIDIKHFNPIYQRYDVSVVKRKAIRKDVPQIEVVE